MNDVKELAQRYYNNETMYYPHEFDDDFKYFDLFKRQIKKISLDDKEPNVHLALNHLITISNVFAIRGIILILKEIMNKEQMKDCNSFLLYLNMIPESQDELNLNPKIFRELVQTVR